MKIIDVKRVIKLLGPAGSSAGLKASSISEKEILKLYKEAKITRAASIDRDSLIEALIESLTQSQLKPIAELMKMSFEELMSHFHEANVSSAELLKLMAELNYKVGAEDRKNLRKYAARQISETALFSRVATRSDTPSN